MRSKTVVNPRRGFLSCKFVIDLFVCALLINPVLCAYGVFVRMAVVNCDVRVFYGIVSSFWNVAALAIVVSVIGCFVTTRMIHKLPLRWRSWVAVSLLLLLCSVQIPRHPLSPIFDGAGNDARVKVHFGKIRLSPFQEDVTLKADPCSFVLALITQCHEVRPYEIFTFSDMAGFVYNRNDQDSVWVKFRDLARERLLLCLKRYKYDRVDVYVCGEKKQSLPLEFDQFNRLKLLDWSCGGTMMGLLEGVQCKKLVDVDNNGYEAHDFGATRVSVNMSK